MKKIMPFILFSVAPPHFNMQHDGPNKRGDSDSDGQSRELSLVALSILHAVARGVTHAFAITRHTGIPGGTVHHSLRRLEHAGWLISEKEERDAARAEKRSPRRNYAITPAGLAKLNDTLARLKRFPPAAALATTPSTER